MNESTPGAATPFRRLRAAIALSLGFAPILVAAWIVLSLTPRRPAPPSDRGCAASCKCPNRSGGPVESVAAASEGAAENEAEAWSRLPQDGRPPRAPNPWFFLERAYPFGRIPRELWQEAQLEARVMRSQRDDRGSWTFRGPTNIGGRVTDLAVDPVDPSIVFAGAAEGGVLRTTDSGQHWTPLFDHQTTLSIGALALDPVQAQIVYAGTGEVNPGGGSVAYGGAGLLRSTDRGDTWSSLGLEDVGSIGRVRIDPTDPQRVYVAAMGDLWTKGPDRGVYRTTDGGTNWEKVLFLSDSTGAVDLILRPDQPRTIFAAMWERIRHPSYYQYGGLTCGVYKTTDGGDTWSAVAGGLPGQSSTRGRIGLSLCVAQPNTMYAVYSDRTGYFDGLYRSTNGGANWTRTNDSGISDVFASYGWWFGNVRVHPVDPNRVWVLGLPIYRSTNGGSSWSDVTGSMHVDQHALDFGPDASPVIYEGNDGGIYRSTNGGSGWTMLPDQPITQLYRVALDAQNPAALYAGAQDNGTVRTLSGLTNDWSMIFGGDGFQPLVHPTNSNRIWAQYQYGALNYSPNGGGSWVDATSGISGSDRHNWNTPVRFDPSNPGRMYYGTQKVYRSTNGTSWSAISPDLTGGGGGGSTYGTVTTLDVSPMDGNVIWAGSDDSHVNVTTNGGTSWTDVSSALPDRWVTSVRAHPTIREACYVTISGFRYGSPLPHIFYTTDLGANWTSVAGNLPEAPANDLVVDPTNPQRLFAATDVGVFETYDGGANWSVLGDNLPNVVVTMLAFNPATRNLYSATYGRSFFSYNIDQPSTAVPAVTAIAPDRILAAAPNPVREGTWIRWESPAAGTGTVEIVAVSGRRVWSREVALSGGNAGGGPANGGLQADGGAPGNGGSRIWWDRRDGNGRRVPAGCYYCMLRGRDGVVGGRSLIVLP
jgi:photosystem II stability/assembly factor-like uncharacterized protein